jgi:hypothetical protein
MTTGQHPFPRPNPIEASLQAACPRPKPVRKLKPDIPPRLSRLITKLLGGDSKKRPTTADFTRPIQRVLNELYGRLPRNRPRSLLQAAACAVLLMTVGGAGWYMLREPPSPLSVMIEEPRIISDDKERLTLATAGVEAAARDVLGGLGCVHIGRAVASAPRTCEPRGVGGGAKAQVHGESHPATLAALGASQRNRASREAAQAKSLGLSPAKPQDSHPGKTQS